MTGKRAYCKANPRCRAVFFVVLLTTISLQTGLRACAIFFGMRGCPEGSNAHAKKISNRLLMPGGRLGHYLSTSIFVTVYAPLTLSATNLTLSPVLT
jgi:hypothetical protein